MTIPYPKREFLNDDDSDSKSSAAKVIIITIILSNIEPTNCLTILAKHLYCTERIVR